MKPPKPPYIQPRGPARIAYESRDWPTLQALLLERTRPQGQCLVWTGPLTKDGYPVMRIGGREYQAHRLMLKTVGVDATGLHVHHACAVPPCVKPQHLTAVTNEQNTAEMLERHWYRRNILDLREALAEAAPDHPLLTEMPFWQWEAEASAAS